MTEKLWLKLTDWPLAGVSLIFLAAYSWEVIGDLEGPRAILTETVIVEQVSAAEQAQETAHSSDMAELTREVRALRALIESGRGDSAS